MQRAVHPEDKGLPRIVVIVVAHEEAKKVSGNEAK